MPERMMIIFRVTSCFFSRRSNGIMEVCGTGVLHRSIVSRWRYSGSKSHITNHVPLASPCPAFVMESNEDAVH